MIEIIMPVYNTGELLKRGVASVLSQNRSDWKLWIIDDGSTDETTKSLLNEYRTMDARINVIEKENGGVSSARNLGLSKTQPDSYIAYCDSDDWWSENHLEESVKTLDRGFDITYCNPTVIDEHNMQVTMNFKLYDEFNAKRMKLGNFIFISSVVHKNGLGEFDSNLNSLEDFDMWIRAANSGKTFCQHKTTSFYLTRKETMASQGRNKLPLLQQKHENFFKTKLHLGCGDQYLNDFVNCDLFAPGADVKLDCSNMRLHSYPFSDNSFEEIMAYHLIEHFDFMQGQDVLREWYRVLKPGGRLHVETPDLLNTCREFVQADEARRVQLYGHFWAWPWLPGQCHKFLYTETQLFWLLGQLGFKNIKRLTPDSIYVPGQDHSLFLNVEAFK